MLDRLPSDYDIACYERLSPADPAGSPLARVPAIRIGGFVEAVVILASSAPGLSQGRSALRPSRA